MQWSMELHMQKSEVPNGQVSGWCLIVWRPTMVYGHGLILSLHIMYIHLSLISNLYLSSVPDY